ncbi:e3 ubiquitin-protein ligase rnf14 [Anaeramoeba flamelloides]|uniref:RBR-type E3 ubiquitin transferase n=1 Tax=Anaeramoeba flamelloides TaxID=1746091 RepID=A0AAV7YIT6_9EUKA|nr:e3 ubiquitin-protein ligase rnf14 [Anaeramoeba flamelloides]
MHQQKQNSKRKKKRKNQFSGIACLEIGLRLLNEEHIKECIIHIKPLFQIKPKYLQNVFKLSRSLTRFSSYLYLMENEETNECNEIFLNSLFQKLVAVSLNHLAAFVVIRQEGYFCLIFLKGKKLKYLLVEPFTRRNRNKISFLSYKDPDQLIRSVIERLGNTKGVQTHCAIYIRKDRYSDQSLTGKMKGDWKLQKINVKKTNKELKLHKKFTKLFDLNGILKKQFSSNNEIIYEYKKKNENLKRAISKNEKKVRLLNFQCNICFSNYPRSQMVFLNCNHKTCKSCLKDHIKFSITNARLPIKCPQHKCTNEIEFKIFKSLNLDQNLIEKYEKFTLQKYLNKHNSELIICPNPKCQLESAIEGNAFFFVCPYCKITYCPKCKTSPFHKYETCLEHKVRIMKERSENRKRILIKKKNDQASELWKKKNTRKCVGCQACVEKNKGCNHMQCTQCHTHFCFECGKIISQNEKKRIVIQKRVEKHYKNNKCIYFTEEMIKK